jgi:hypothetical protein
MEEIREPKTSSVFRPNDLNPESSMDFRYIAVIVSQKEEGASTEAPSL